MPGRPPATIGLVTDPGIVALVGGLWWFIPGMLLAMGYAAVAYRHFAGKVG